MKFHQEILLFHRPGLSETNALIKSKKNLCKQMLFIISMLKSIKHKNTDLDKSLAYYQDKNVP